MFTNLSNILYIEISKLQARPEEARLHVEKVQLVHDKVQGRALPVVHHQVLVKNTLWQVVGKGCQAKMSCHVVLWASACKVAGCIIFIKDREGSAA